ncbi:hypothetical protein BOTBODRAFT_286400 [Botryobasidium botryosum FD-172 SS1]|uniref:Uncharacterized protein n=1 Tax=Botryobasidium botryosum (strain FD-172 SS1) TaxID=930990 RepID=A0A067MVY4_BOTB1|nr:hypothetical protein BOTBODRAFT_286400 [Botryobasidium botryosum FD-172 SS1]
MAHTHTLSQWELRLESLKSAVEEFTRACKDLSELSSPTETNTARDFVSLDVISRRTRDKAPQIEEITSQLLGAQSLIRALGYYSTTSTPISRLPETVLRTIFILGTAEDLAEYLTLGHDTEKETFLPNFATTASHVCRHWRSVALSTSVLWRHIEIRPQNHSIERAKLWIARSQACDSLQLILILPSDPLLLDFVRPYLARCSDLWAIGYADDLASVLAQYEETRGLRKITFHQLIPVRPHSDGIMAMCGLLHVQALSMLNTFPPVDRKFLGRLKELHLDSPDDKRMKYFTTVLSFCSQLEILKLSYCIVRGASQRDPILMPSLKELSITLDAPSEFPPLLSLFDAPHLHTLELHTPALYQDHEEFFHESDTRGDVAEQLGVALQRFAFVPTLKTTGYLGVLLQSTEGAFASSAPGDVGRELQALSASNCPLYETGPEQRDRTIC